LQVTKGCGWAVTAASGAVSWGIDGWAASLQVTWATVAASWGADRVIARAVGR